MHSRHWLQIWGSTSTQSRHVEDHPDVSCDGCTLCCKIPRIPALDKKSNEWCGFCNRNKGCSIYQLRPTPCVDFNCLWLSGQQPVEWRPDRVHLYTVEESNDLIKVRVDADHPTAWQEGVGKQMVDHFRSKGKHVLVSVGMQLTFLPAKDKPCPDKLLIDWLL